MSRARVAIVVASVLALTGTVVGTALSQGEDPDAGVPFEDPLRPERERVIVTSTAPGARHGCGSLGRAFDNPVGGYSVCFPSSWGVLRLTDRAPATTIDGLEAHTVRIASSAAFPWQPGQSPFAGVAAGATIIEINTLPAFTPSSEDGDCVPTRKLAGGGRSCELALDARSLLPSAKGTLLEIMAVVPISDGVVLARAHLQPDPARRANVMSILSTLRSLEAAS